MSRASEWAARDKARVEKLEVARERIEAELGRDGKDKPGPFLNNANILADVAHSDGRPRLVMRGQAHLDAQRAIEFGRWIIATFGDEAAR